MNYRESKEHCLEGRFDFEEGYRVKYISIGGNPIQAIKFTKLLFYKLNQSPYIKTELLVGNKYFAPDKMVSIFRMYYVTGRHRCIHETNFIGV